MLAGLEETFVLFCLQLCALAGIWLTATGTGGLLGPDKRDSIRDGKAWLPPLMIFGELNMSREHAAVRAEFEKTTAAEE
jgi:hypothetical protein